VPEDRQPDISDVAAELAALRAQQAEAAAQRELALRQGQQDHQVLHAALQRWQEQDAELTARIARIEQLVQALADQRGAPAPAPALAASAATASSWAAGDASGDPLLTQQQQQAAVPVLRQGGSLVMGSESSRTISYGAAIPLASPPQAASAWQGRWTNPDAAPDLPLVLAHSLDMDPEDGFITDVRVSPAGTMLAALTVRNVNDGELQLWPVAVPGRPATSIPVLQGLNMQHVSAFAWSPDGSKLAVTFNGRWLPQQDTATGSPEQGQQHQYADRPVLAVYDMASGCQLWRTVRAPAGAPHDDAQWHNSEDIITMAWSPDGRHIATTHEVDSDPPVSDMSDSPDSSGFGGVAMRQVAVYDASNGAFLQFLAGLYDGYSVGQVAYSPDGAKLGVMCGVGVVRVYAVHMDYKLIETSGRCPSDTGPGETSVYNVGGAEYQYSVLRPTEDLLWMPDGRRVVLKQEPRQDMSVVDAVLAIYERLKQQQEQQQQGATGSQAQGAGGESASDTADQTLLNAAISEYWQANRKDAGEDGPQERGEEDADDISQGWQSFAAALAARNGLYQWDCFTRERQLCLSAEVAECVGSMAIGPGPDGCLAATAETNQNRVRVWDTSKTPWRCIHTMDCPEPYQVSISASGLVTASTFGRTIHIWQPPRPFVATPDS